MLTNWRDPNLVDMRAGRTDGPGTLTSLRPVLNLKFQNKLQLRTSQVNSRLGRSLFFSDFVRVWFRFGARSARTPDSGSTQTKRSRMKRPYPVTI